MENGTSTLTAIIIPTFNEKENLERLIQEIVILPFPKEIIIVDDDSPDGTGDIADVLATQLPGINVIHREAKLGLGTAYRAGFQKGFSLKADLMVTMDADFSHAPRYIPDLIKTAVKNDVAIGSRYIAAGGTVNFGLHRQLLSWGANLVARSALKLNPRDCTSGFRCYNRYVLEKVNPDTIVSDGYSFLVEMLFSCIQAGFTVDEIPIIFVNRAQGKSKISKREIFKAMNTIWQLFKQQHKRVRE
ncbi:polyprenol monophosphomannose synthase [candidate division CSSED10-310 bacterium]|uniref:Polyprenol monophosphomannose synthase n=1 Tax=candidate division CSSED10-310 bacterium TaxID=2855610 RepID=A0ABV6YYD4_UNCC1